MHKFALYGYAGAALAAIVAPLRAARVHAIACDAGWFNPDQTETADFHLVAPSGDEDRDAEFLEVLAKLFGPSAGMLDDTKHEGVKALLAASKPKGEPGDAPKTKAAKAPKAPKDAPKAPEVDKPDDDETNGE